MELAKDHTVGTATFTRMTQPMLTWRFDDGNAASPGSTVTDEILSMPR